MLETYHIFNYKQFKPSYILILVKGLREESRIKSKLSDSDGLSQDTLLLASIVDRLSIICSWVTGVKFNDSVVEALVNREKKPHEAVKGNDIRSFSSINEFTNMRYGGET